METDYRKAGLLSDKKIRQLIGAFLVILFFEVLSFFAIPISFWAKISIFTVLMVIFGRKVVIDGTKSLFKFDFSDINLLMTIAIFGAMYLGQFEEAVIIVILFSLGEALEDYGIRQSKSALEKLIQLAPKSAMPKGAKEKVAIDNIEPGTILIIKPGDIIPMDGVVVLGNSLVSESMITGELLPQPKFEGDSVYAGTENNNGYLEVRISKKAKDTTLAKIIDLTYQSAEQKSRPQIFIEIFARYYTPAIIIVAILVMVIPVLVLGGEFNFWFTQAVTLLIISCPCALVISTPVTIFSAIGNATRRGAMVKGGRFLEEMDRIKVVAFDKTRTLTKGEPEVSDIIPFNGFSTDEVLACAAGLEIFSEHPIAKSIITKAQDLGLPIHEFKDFKAIIGQGVTGECLVCENSRHCLGNLKFVSNNNDRSVEDYIVKKINELEEQGKTPIIISEQKTIKGIIAITDKIREESAETIKSIATQKIKSVMLTGDSERPAHYVADYLGITDVRAGLLPEQKDSEIQKLSREYGPVIMVGDGVNDAPALARSSVGIAIGAIGSDLAIENADIALMNNDLALIPYLIALGRECSAKIRFNVWMAIGVKLLFILLSISGHGNIAMAVLADVGITIVVVLNGLSLFRFGHN